MVIIFSNKNIFLLEERTMSKIMPEIHHNYRNLSLDEITSACQTGESVTGFVESIDEATSEIKVRLGNDIYARLPFSEVTIYPFSYSKRVVSTLPINIKVLLNNKIRVKVTHVSHEAIYVSRKKNMEQAYKEILKLKRASFYITEVITRTAFGDIGDGVVGKLFINDVCRSHIHSVSEYFSRGQTIECAIGKADEANRIGISYKDMFTPYRPEDYTVGMPIRCKVGNWIRITDTSVYFVNITPQVSGIMIIPGHKHIDYGREVECVINNITNDGLYLDFCKLA